MDLAGIFINEGPLSILSRRNIKPQTIKDENRGTIFNGPLILIINGQSASASEVLAASLQDYNRALIVGQDSYGKATGQVIFPNDTSTSYEKINNRDFQNNSSFVKMTVSKLYRITGKTAQKNGIHPDVSLPDVYKGLYKKEKDYKTVLSSDSIIKKTYYTPLEKFPVEKLQLSSVERLQSDSILHDAILVRDSILAYIENNKNGINLDFESYVDQEKEIIRLIDFLSTGKPDMNRIFKVENHAYEDKVISLDEYQRELNMEVRTELKGDPILMETYRIMIDLISFTKK
jgi:carboxyl-terminal processing protease